MRCIKGAQLKNYRVLVLEQLYTAGGYTHSFSRVGGFKWDVGLHYVGRMHPGTHLRKIFDFITGGGVQWNQMPDPFEIFSYPGFTFKVSSDAKKYQAALIKEFPEEGQAIKRYFKDMRIIPKYILGRFLPRVLRPMELSKMEGVNGMHTY